MVDNHTGNVAPQWLTQDYLEDALKKYKKDRTLRIIDLEIMPAIPKGENFASVMIRVLITFEYGKELKTKKQVSYIVKTDFESDTRVGEIYKPYQAFKTEMEIYENVLPQITKLLQKIGDQDKLFAETIHVDFERKAIVFEDLAVSNFQVANRINGMDMDHTKLALRKLAKMHAAAAVLNERSNGSLELFTRGIFNRHTRGFGCIFERLLGVCAEFAGNCPELGNYYKEKILSLIPHVVENAINACEPKKGQFLTLTHGDFWINNIMLRYDDSERGNTNGLRRIKDIMLIDFQFCKWTSPAMDLHYFFNTSLESKLRLNNQEELVQFYHQILRQTLEDLDYKGHIPSLHEFCVQMEDRRFYSLTSSLVVRAFMINDSKDSDPQALLFDDERARNFRKMLYENPDVQENAKALLPFFDRHGLLDVTG